MRVNGEALLQKKNFFLCVFSAALVVCGDRCVATYMFEQGSGVPWLPVYLSIETRMAWMYIQLNERDRIEERKLDGQTSDPGQ